MSQNSLPKLISDFDRSDSFGNWRHDIELSRTNKWWLTKVLKCVIFSQPTKNIHFIIIKFRSFALVGGVSSVFFCFQLFSLPPDMITASLSQRLEGRFNTTTALKVPGLTLGSVKKCALTSSRRSKASTSPTALGRSCVSRLSYQLCSCAMSRSDIDVNWGGKKQDF